MVISCILAAKFVVVSRGAGVVSLQWARDQRRYLGIYDSKLTFGGGHFPQCAFHVVESGHAGDHVSFESLAHPGQHMGILPSGEPQPPAVTGRGPQGSFYPVYVDEKPMLPNLGLKSKAYWNLEHGNVVVLTSCAYGKNLRIHPDGRVDCQGGWGDLTKFIIETRGNGVIAIRSWKSPQFYLNITPDNLAAGAGGDLCDFVPEDPRDYPDGGVDSITFAFAGNRDIHIGVRPNGELKPPKDTATGTHGQFRVTPCDKLIS
jgi:hypothetical protein